MPRRIHTVPTGGIGQLVGIQQIVKVTQPAAGAEWTYTLPGGYFYRLVSGTAKFVTSAAVANRLVGISVTTTEGIVFQAGQASNLAASNTVTVCYSPAATGQASGGVKGAWQCYAPQWWIPSGYTIQSSTAAMDVADQYSLVVLLFEQLDYGQYGIPELAHPPTLDELEHIPAKYDVEV